MTIVCSSPFTYDDLLQMPDDGFRYEIIDGELIVSPAPSRVHQELAGRLHVVLRPFAEANQLGKVFFAPVDVRLSPHHVVQPDLIFIRQDRLHIYQPEGVIDGPPDLVVEIISPTSRSRDEVKKARLYEWAGIPEYWQADPETPTLRLFVLVNGRYQEAEPVNGILRSTVLPGLEIDIAALFADLE